jgi:hypothetical protein
VEWVVRSQRSENAIEISYKIVVCLKLSFLDAFTFNPVLTRLLQRVFTHGEGESESTENLREVALEIPLCELDTPEVIKVLMNL